MDMATTAALVMLIGTVFFLVIGGAITRPLEITSRFIKEMEK